MKSFKISENDAGLRIDKYLSKVLANISRSQIQKLLNTNDCKVNGKVVKKNHILKTGDQVRANLRIRRNSLNKTPKIRLKFLIKSHDYMVIDKPAGIAVHGECSITNLISKLLFGDFADKSRPGIVHRLDKQTSGCLIVGRSQNATEYFQKQFKNRTVKKVYMALVKGKLKHKQGIIDSPIERDTHDRKKMAISSKNSAKNATSKFKVINEFLNCSLLKIEPLTGRTHQIRVHMKAIGHPIVGDKVYGDKAFNLRFEVDFGLKRQFLHAYSLEFTDFKFPHKRKLAVSPLHNDLQIVIKQLKYPKSQQ